MTNFKTLSAIVLTSFLAACGGGEADRNTPDVPVPTNTPTVVPSPTTPPVSGDHIPFAEDFGANSTVDFYDRDYKELFGDYPEEEDQFYFSTGGVFNNGALDPNGGNWITADNDQSMRLGNSRFSIAQPARVPGDARTKTTLSNDESTWGELDLSQNYRLSFCVVASSEANSGSSLFQLYVDNNSTSSGDSIHGGSSRVVNIATSAFVPGKRVVINIPGDYDLNEDGTAEDTVDENVGTETSFIQLRVSSGGYIVLDDMVLEYQSDTSLGDGQTGCADKTTAWAEENPFVDAPDPTPTPIPTDPPTPTDPPVDGDVAWSSYSADLTPTSDNSITLSDSTTDSFEASNPKPNGDEDLFTAVGDGTVTLVTEGDEKSMLAKYGFADFAATDYPRFFTGLIRAQGNSGFKVTDLDINLADTAGLGSRIKLVLRADSEDGVQMDKGDPDSKPTGYTDGVPYDVYRIYQVAIELTSATEGEVKVYQDGSDTALISLTASSTGDIAAFTSTDDNYVRFGDGSSGTLDYKGVIDWFIWTDQGAYSPSELKGKLPSGIGDISAYEASSLDVSWNSYSADLTPTSDNSITLSDSTTDSFEASNPKPNGDEDLFTAVGDGTVTLVTEGDEKSMLAKYGFADFAATDYPRFFTGLIRAQGNSGFKVTDLDINLADTAGLGSRIKLVLRADSEDGVQMDKGDPDSKPTGYTDGVPYDVYRIYQVAIELTSATEGEVKVYQDGSDTALISLTASSTGDIAAFTSTDDNYVRFGDGSSGTLDYKGVIDWFIWTDQGAYSPSELSGALPIGIGDTTGY